MPAIFEAGLKEKQKVGSEAGPGIEKEGSISSNFINFNVGGNQFLFLINIKKGSINFRVGGNQCLFYLEHKKRHR